MGLSEATCTPHLQEPCSRTAAKTESTDKAVTWAGDRTGHHGDSGLATGTTDVCDSVGGPGGPRHSAEHVGARTPTTSLIAGRDKGLCHGRGDGSGPQVLGQAGRSGRFKGTELQTNGETNNPRETGRPEDYVNNCRIPKTTKEAGALCPHYKNRARQVTHSSSG